MNWKPRCKTLLRWTLVLYAIFGTTFALYLGRSALELSMLNTMSGEPEEIARMFNRLPMVAVMAIGPSNMKELWNEARAGNLEPGDRAPDFTLAAEDGSRDVTLSSFRAGKPVVLVFGSYT